MGGGPAGFYTAKLIAKAYPNSTIDIFEKNPLPFGLVRYGVSPDHQDVKKLANDMNRVG